METIKYQVGKMFPRTSKNTQGHYADEIFKAIIQRLRKEDINNSQVNFAIGKLKEEWIFERE